MYLNKMRQNWQTEKCLWILMIWLYFQYKHFEKMKVRVGDQEVTESTSRPIKENTLCGSIEVKPTDHIWMTFFCPGSGVKGQYITVESRARIDLYEIMVLGKFLDCRRATAGTFPSFGGF